MALVRDGERELTTKAELISIGDDSNLWVVAIGAFGVDATGVTAEAVLLGR